MPSGLRASKHTSRSRSHSRLADRGFGATLCLDVPFALLQFPLYEYLKGRLAQWRASDAGGGGAASATSVAATDGALAGALAGATAALLTTPLDVTRTRHVLWEGERTTLMTTVGRIYALDGWRGFMRGAMPRTVYMALGGTLYLGTYSYVSAVLVRVLHRD
jgi:solute carrier family 25 S-adenosylmethionine transporter 26